MEFQIKPRAMNTTCPCGGDLSPETIELAAAFPMLYPVPLCDACSELEDERTRMHNLKLEADLEQAKRLSRLEVIPPEMRQTREEFTGFNRALWHKIKDWTPEGIKWLGLVGAAGKCKTRCISLLAKKLIIDGHHLTWTTALQFQHNVDALRLGNSEEIREAHKYINRCQQTDVLVFDDFGKNTWNPSVERHLLDMIDIRKTYHRPVVWSANTHPMAILNHSKSSQANITERLSQDRGAPLIGRLIEVSYILGLDGKIIRMEAA